MAFDFKKEYKEFYLPKNKPEIVVVPPMKYVAVRGEGDQKEEAGLLRRRVPDGGRRAVRPDDAPGTL